MKRNWSDGASSTQFSPLELTERLAALVPTSRGNQLLHAGILVGNAAWRAEVAPRVPSSTDAEREARTSLRLVKRDAKRGRDKLPDDAPLGWAEGLKRLFGFAQLRRLGLPPAATTGGFTRGRERGRGRSSATNPLLDPDRGVFRVPRACRGTRGGSSYRRVPAAVPFKFLFPVDGGQGLVEIHGSRPAGRWPPG